MGERKSAADIEARFQLGACPDPLGGGVTQKKQFGSWVFCTINDNRENGERCCDLVDDLQHRPRVCVIFLVFALQETDNWNLTGMQVLGLSSLVGLP